MKITWNFCTIIENIRKVIFNTHKIKSKKEYGFSKQKNNRNGFYISFFCFKNPHPFRKPLYSKSTPFPSKNFRLYDDDWLMKSKQKIKKKRAKVSSRFTKKQVQALRVFEKISTLSGSIFSKKLAFLKPSTWYDGFLFFSFFSFEKFYVSRVARHTCISRENPRKIENLINF